MANTDAKKARETRKVSAVAAGRSPYLVWLIWVVWLPLSVPTLIALFQSHPTPLYLTTIFVGVVLFFGIYLWSSRLRARHLVAAPSQTRAIETSTWLTILALNGLSLGLTLLAGNEWLSLFFYTSGYVGGSLPLRWAILVASIMTLIAAAVGLPTGLAWANLVQAVVFIPAIVFITKSVLWSITTSWALDAAREEIARLAVVTERLRIARDLHDLLGHNLSLITIKSELAGRLLTVAPERAAIEIRDVENVARTTLQEVREAVGNYRQPSLSSELHAAQEILAAAGITYQCEGDEEVMNTLPTAIEAVIAWTVREGVTNIIRHSRAHHCTIHLARAQERVSIDILDDGTGSPLTSSDEPKDGNTTSTINNRGNGLRGLAERVNALGGHFDASPSISGGFHLSVSVPLAQKALQPGTSIILQYDSDSIQERNPQV